MYMGGLQKQQVENLIVFWWLQMFLGLGKTNKTWLEVVKNNVKALNLTDKIAIDPTGWRSNIHADVINWD